MKVTGITIQVDAHGARNKIILIYDCNWRALYSLHEIGTMTGRLGNKSREHPHDSIIKFGKNTEKSPADLRRYADTET